MTETTHLAAVLTGEEVLLARTAVRQALTKIRGDYRNDTRHAGREHYAETKLRRFDDYLDLYEVLGGDPSEIPDPEDATEAVTHPAPRPTRGTDTKENESA